jgi:hypothetical protein
MPINDAAGVCRETTMVRMSVREPNPTSMPSGRGAYPGQGRGPAWSIRGLLAVILAIVAVALVIWFALGG